MILYEQFDHRRLPSALGTTEEHGAILTFSIAVVAQGRKREEDGVALNIQVERPLPSGAPLPLRSPHHWLMRSATSFSYPWSDGW